MVLLKDEIKALVDEALTPVTEDIKKLPNMKCVDNLVKALSKKPVYAVWSPLRRTRCENKGS